MKQTGTFHVYEIKNSQRVVSPIPNAFIYFVQNNSIKLTVKTDDKGKYSFDLPLGEYTVVSSSEGGIEQLLANGSKFILNAQSKVTAFEEWVNAPSADVDTALLKRFKELAKIAEDAAREANEALAQLEGNSIGTGKWLRESASYKDWLTTKGIYQENSTTFKISDMSAGDFGIIRNNGAADYPNITDPFIFVETQLVYATNAAVQTIKPYGGRQAWGVRSRLSSGTYSDWMFSHHTGNTRTDKNKVLHSGTGTPLTTLNTSDMVQDIVNRDDVTVTSGAVFRDSAKKWDIVTNTGYAPDKSIDDYRAGEGGYSRTSNGAPYTGMDIITKSQYGTADLLQIGLPQRNVEQLMMRTKSSAGWNSWFEFYHTKNLKFVGTGDAVKKSELDKYIPKSMPRSDQGWFAIKAVDSGGAVLNFECATGFVRGNIIVSKDDGLSFRQFKEGDPLPLSWNMPLKSGRFALDGDYGIGGISLTSADGGSVFSPDVPNGVYSKEGVSGSFPMDRAGTFLKLRSNTGQDTGIFTSAVDNFGIKSIPRAFLFAIDGSSWRTDAEFYTSVNTAVDSNGFIKKASPIIRLFNDRIETNNQFPEDPVFERISEGTYKISNTLGLAQEGWTYEKPRGSDGNPYFRVLVKKTEDGCVISVHDEYDSIEEATITDIDGNTRKINKVVKVLSQARDIKPHERWIDLRFHEDPREEIETLEVVQ